MQKMFRGLGLSLFFCVAVRMAAPEAASAATHTVTSLNDSGAGTLRNLIAAAGSGDTINFGVTGTINLTSGELLINKNLDIYGPSGGGVTIQRSLAGGTPNFRIFNILSGNTVNILFLTIANGNVIGGGGGVQTAGSTTLFNCTFSNNKATTGAGGGLAASGVATVSGCSFWNNSTTISGGGIYNDAAMNVNNSTFYGNSPEGIVNGAGNLDLNHCTIYANSNSVWNSQLIQTALITLKNTIIAGKTDPLGIDVSGPMVSEGFNIIGQTNNPQATIAWQSTDQVGSAAAPFDPLLGPLQNNGGISPNMAPLPGSPAIDRGTSGGLATDQRVFLRPFDLPWVANAAGGDGSDIGAVELNATNRIVTTLADAGSNSLRLTIIAASNWDGDRITFASNLVGNITLTNGELAISKNLIIDGPGAGVIGVSGNNASRVFSILDGAVSISGLTICNGRVATSPSSTEQDGFDGRGGGIYNQSTLWLSGCVVSNNAAIGGAGGPSSLSGAGNGGKGYGGGICNIATLSVSDSLILSNSATGGAGGPTVDGFAGGGGNGLGGGLYSAVGKVALRNVMIRHASAAGGAGGAATGTGSAGAGGQGYGGAFYNDSAAGLSGCTLADSTAIGAAGGGGTGSGSGGGLYNNGGYAGAALALSNCTVSGNSVQGSFNFGGGFYDQDSDTILRSCTVAGNSADYGGGYYVGGAAPDVANTILAGNSATSSGNDASGNIQSGDYNLVQDTSGITFSGATTHNLTGVNPALGPLRDNGGRTFTLALLAGSPAIDKGKSFGLLTDQRGLRRPFNFPTLANAAGGDAADIGAFEVNPPTLTITRSGPNVLLRWPTNDTGYTLEAVTSLTAPLVWAGAGSPSVVGDFLTVTNPAAGDKFYRLRFP